MCLYLDRCSINHFAIHNLDPISDCMQVTSLGYFGNRNLLATLASHHHHSPNLDCRKHIMKETGRDNSSARLRASLLTCDGWKGIQKHVFTLALLK